MPAYAKISLVSSVFHPSDVAFAISWSNSAVGFDGWRVVLDKPEQTEMISVIPPGSDVPVFFISRVVGEVLLERQPVGGERTEAARFADLREAVLNLCPLSDDAVEEIHTALERDFPRPPER